VGAGLCGRLGQNGQQHDHCQQKAENSSFHDGLSFDVFWLCIPLAGKQNGHGDNPPGVSTTAKSIAFCYT
jgi:hypothetical protein